MAWEDERWLRHTFALAERAVDEGDQAYGAALVDSAGNLLLEAANQRQRSGRCTAHAETDLVSEASQLWPRTLLSGCTLYSSTEPCPMCAGAIAWSGVGRLVYGLSQERSYALARFEPPPRFIEPPSCRAILGNVQPPIEVLGPLLEDEATAVHLRWYALHAGEPSALPTLQNEKPPRGVTGGGFC